MANATASDVTACPACKGKGVVMSRDSAPEGMVWQGPCPDGCRWAYVANGMLVDVGEIEEALDRLRSSRDAREHKAEEG